MAALAGLVGAGSNIVKNYFEINRISVDNWTFKLYYKYSTTLFIFSAMIVNHKQFFGDPILCDAGHASGGLNGDVLDTYCWMFSTFHVQPEYKGHCSAVKGDLKLVRGDLEHSRQDQEEQQTVYNSYYQWVPLYLLISAVVFHVPRVVWLKFEGGLMKFFSRGTTGRQIENVEEKKEKLIFYFKNCVSRKYNVYFGTFVTCEFLNLVIVVSHFFITDKFLNHRYLWYGWDFVLYHTTLSPGEQRAQWNPNPGCRTFPRVASCNYYRYGPAGGQEKVNALCILALNIINDKVFAVIWIWCACLSLISVTMLLYRIIICSSSYLRLQILNQRVGRTDITKHEKIIEYLNKRPLGDWFVLYQMSKNLRRHFFIEFLTDLSAIQEEDKSGEDKLEEEAGDNVLTMFMRPSFLRQDTNVV